MDQKDLIEFFDYKITKSLHIDQINRCTINTLNPHSFIVSKSDLSFKIALQNCDILIPDGVGVVWGIKILTGISINRVSGYDLFVFMMNDANRFYKRCYFLGSTNHVLNLIKKRISKDFPNVVVEFLSPPFKDEFNNNDNEFMIQSINDFKPDYLFVGMTAPKQEKWLYENKSKLIVGTSAAIGAVFDFYAGTVKRPSSFWINLGLEWLPRFFKEPRRLWKRNLISTPLFIYEIFKARFF